MNIRQFVVSIISQSLIAVSIAVPTMMWANGMISELSLGEWLFLVLVFVTGCSVFMGNIVYEDFMKWRQNRNKNHA